MAQTPTARLALDAKLRVDNLVDPEVDERQAEPYQRQAQARRCVPPPSIAEKGISVLGEVQDGAPTPAFEAPYPQERQPRLHDDCEQRLEKEASGNNGGFVGQDLEQHDPPRRVARPTRLAAT